MLAALNAFVLRALLFGDDEFGHLSPRSHMDGRYTWQNPSPQELRTALLAALARIISKAASGGCEDGNGGAGSHGASSKLIVCLPKKTPHLYRSSAYTPDGVSERLQICTFEIPEEEGGSGGLQTEASLRTFLDDHLEHFMDPVGCGALLLLYSCVFSRGLTNVRADMDDGFAGEVRTLCDRHSYLSQEGVNLLLLGRAVSNVFDGDKELGDQGQGSADIVRLGGVPRRGDVGFLTLQEAYGYYEVGEHYKTPRVPIWVVYSESHYSILLSPDLFLVANTNRGEGSSASHSSTARCSRYGSFLAAEPFDLYYWDMLADQDEVVRLTVTPNINGIELPDIHDKQALIPPLDLVVRTKWPGHLVGWNGTDAIL